MGVWHAVPWRGRRIAYAHSAGPGFWVWFVYAAATNHRLIKGNRCVGVPWLDFLKIVLILDDVKNRFCRCCIYCTWWKGFGFIACAHDSTFDLMWHLFHYLCCTWYQGQGAMACTWFQISLDLLSISRFLLLLISGMGCHVLSCAHYFWHAWY